MRRFQFQVVFALLIVSSVQVSTAFINIEAVRQDATEGFLGKSSAKLAGQSGNTNKLSLNVSTVNLNAYKEDELLLLGDYSYAYSSKIRDTNNARLHLRYTFKAKEKRSYETLAQAEYDEFKNLNSRVLAGGNLRHSLSNSETSSLYLGTGSFYEIEDYKLIPVRRGVRGNLYLSYVEQLNERVEATSVVYFQPAFRELEDFRVRLQTGLEVAMTRSLSLDLEFSLTHDNWVPEDVVPTDVTYFAGLSVKY